MQIYLQNIFANMFPHSEGNLLVLLIVSFAVEKLFNLMQPHLFVFAFFTLTWGDISKNILQSVSFSKVKLMIHEIDGF